MRQRKEGQEIELKSSTICNMTNMIRRRDSSRVKQENWSKFGWEGKGKYNVTWKRRSLELEKDWDGKER